METEHKQNRQSFMSPTSRFTCALSTCRSVNEEGPTSSTMDEEGSTGNQTPSVVHEDQEFFESLPPGTHFVPTDKELIEYLKKVIQKQPLPRNKILTVDIYRYSPEMLAELYKGYGEGYMYFFTPRHKKYKNGHRTSRTALDGYWKTTVGDKAIKHRGVNVGYKKTLIFCRGKPQRGESTDWIMYEYRVNDDALLHDHNTDGMMLDEWVLCKIYKKQKGFEEGWRIRKGYDDVHRKRHEAAMEDSLPPAKEILNQIYRTLLDFAVSGGLETS